MKAIPLSLAVVTLVALYVVVRVAVGAYVKFRGSRVVTSPETKTTVALELDAGRAALTAGLDEPELRVTSRSHWPERQDCGQRRLERFARRELPSRASRAGGGPATSATARRVRAPAVASASPPALQANGTINAGDVAWNTRDSPSVASGPACGRGDPGLVSCAARRCDARTRVSTSRSS